MVARSESNYAITLTIRSEAEQVSLLCEALHALCLYASGSVECALAVQQAAAEAINNVVEHAYHNRPDNEIVVGWCQEERQIHIDILDTGLSMVRLPKPVLPDFEAESSRGWWIINASVDKYFYQTICDTFDGPVLHPGGIGTDFKVLENIPHTNILTLLKRF